MLFCAVLILVQKNSTLAGAAYGARKLHVTSTDAFELLNIHDVRVHSSSSAFMLESDERTETQTVDGP